MCFSRDFWCLPVTLWSFLEVTCSRGGQRLGCRWLPAPSCLCVGQPGHVGELVCPGTTLEKRGMRAGRLIPSLLGDSSEVCPAVSGHMEDSGNLLTRAHAWSFSLRLTSCSVPLTSGITLPKSWAQGLLGVKPKLRAWSTVAEGANDSPGIHTRQAADPQC